MRSTIIHFLELVFADESTVIHMEELPVKAFSCLVNITLQESRILQDFNLISIAKKN